MPALLRALAVGIALGSVPAHAGETSAKSSWPAFRGQGDSLADRLDLPLRWGEKSGVAWRAEISGYGQSSPVIWGERVYVTSAVGERKQESAVSAYDLASGRRLWIHKFKATAPAKVSGYISVAAPTAVVDRRAVYAFFETGDIAAVDHGGKVLWRRWLVKDYGPFQGNHGLGSSLAQTAESVIVLVDHAGPSYLLALDKKTGKTLWKTDRREGVAWTSPIVTGRGDDARIIVSSSGSCAAYDAKSGKQLWTLGGIEGNTVPSATVAGELIVIGSSRVGSNLAIRRPADKPGAEPKIVWRSDEATATFSSPLVYRGHVYLVNRAGVAFCLDAATGKTRWRQRIGESCWASPLGSEGRVYFFGKSGATTVMAAGAKPRVLAENKLPTDNRVYGVAAAPKRLIVRTGSQLICLSEAAREVGNAAAGDAQKGKAKLTSKSKSNGRKADQESTPQVADLPKAITSFGAARLGDAIYIYGGHHGRAHHYSQQGQSGELRRLDINKPDKWTVAATGPRLQGLSLEAYGGKLYRVGGFTARNKEGEDHDLHSEDDFAEYDPATGKWRELPPMPEPRSSFDSAMIGSRLYVVGGWAMRGDKETQWSKSAYVIDLADENPKWKAIAKPPFERRALAVGSLGGRLYVIGGMQPDGKVSRETAIYDPDTDRWSGGPTLPEPDMEGFGAACRELGKRLYVSTSSGRLLRLSQDGKSWKTVAKLERARFFHQLLPWGKDSLLLVGGANMETGRFRKNDVAPVAP